MTTEIEKLTTRLINFTKKKHIEKILVTGEKLLKLDSENLVALFTLGKLYVEAELYDRALPLLEKAAILKKTDAEILMYLGLAQLGFGYQKESIKTFQRACLFDSHNARIWVNLGLAQREYAQYEDALKSLDKAIALDPHSCPAYLNKGITLQKLNRYQQAKHCLEKTLEINQEYVPGLNALAILAEAEQDLSAAKKYLEKCVQLNPSSADAYSNLAAIMLKEEDFSPVEAMLKKSIKLAPNNYRSYVNLVAYYNLTEQKNKAKDLLEVCIKKFPANADLAVIMSIELYNKKHFYEAIALLKNYEHLNIASIYNYLAGCHHAIMDLDTARKYYLKSLKLRKDDNIEQGLHNTENEAKILKSFVGQASQLWTGEPLNKKDSLFIIKQQGIGDEILYARDYNRLLDQVDHLTITTEQKLVPLFRSSFPKAKVFAFDFKEAYGQKFIYNSSTNTDQYQGDYTWFVGASRVHDNLAAFDGPYAPFFSASEAIQEKWKAKLSQHLAANKLKVGVCWRSFNMKSHRQIYYAKVEEMAALWALENQVSFVNLQYDECNDELDKINKIFHVNIYNPDIDQFNELEEVVGLMQNLDLVISPSGAVHMLAAAAGTPTLKFVPNNPLSKAQVNEYKFNNLRHIFREQKSPKEHWFTDIATIIQKEFI